VFFIILLTVMREGVKILIFLDKHELSLNFDNYKTEYTINVTLTIYVFLLFLNQDKI